jgi:2-dehydro-3-deoxyphosphogluconate aldolase/(4S)-4-hydroxy-2-oxoglutarate aldolase
MTAGHSATLAAFAAHRASAILRTDDPTAVRPALDAAIAGGFRLVEVTMTTPDCLAHVRALAANPDLIVGCGTVLTAADAAAAHAAGARFLVSPVTDPDVIGYCRSHGLVSLPGAFTPTEMLTAHRAGADLVKLFPGPANGPEYLRMVRGPLPFLRIVPTSGVTEDNVDGWLQAGAFGVGFVGSLFAAEDLAHKRFDAIAQRAARLLAKVRAHGPARA